MATLLLFFVGPPLQRWSLPGGLALTELLLILMPVLTILWAKGDLREVMARGGLSTSSLPELLLLGVGAFLVAVVAGVVAHPLLRLMNYQGATPQVLGALLAQNDATRVWWTVASVVILAPVCEEALFRGLMQTCLRRVAGAGVAVVLPAVAFGVFHLHPLRFVPMCAVGAVAGFARERHGSMWAAVVVHAVVNSIGVALAAVAMFSRGGAH